MIRRATPSDFKLLRSLAVEFHAESHYRDFALADEVVDRIIRKSFSDPSMCCLVASDGVGITGFFIGYVSTFFFSNELGAWDLVFYITPQARGGESASLLLTEFIKWAVSKGTKAVFVGVSTGITIERTRRLYERHGFRVTGHNFRLYTVDSGSSDGVLERNEP